MIKVDYGLAIDTLDHVLDSKLVVTSCGDCLMPTFLAEDPRANVKELAKQFEFFQTVNGKVPEYVEKGQVSNFIYINWYVKTNLILFYVSVPNFEYIVVGPKNYLQSRGKYGKLHASNEKLWIKKQVFLLPKASPLYVSS